MMRLWNLPAILGLAILLLVVALPVFWQWDYQVRLLRAVPVGSTREQYKKALLAGDLGPGFLRPTMTYARPINFHGVVYTIFAYPRWDASAHLLGYGLSIELSWPGHSKWWHRPSVEELDAMTK